MHRTALLATTVIQICLTKGRYFTLEKKDYIHYKECCEWLQLESIFQHRSNGLRQAFLNSPNSDDAVLTNNNHDDVTLDEHLSP